MKTHIFFLPLFILLATDPLNASFSVKAGETKFQPQGKAKIEKLLHLYQENAGNPKALSYINQLLREAELQKDEDLQQKMMGVRIQAFVNVNMPDSVMKYGPSTIDYLRDKRNYRMMFSIQDLIIGQYIYSKRFPEALKKVNELFEEAKYLNNPMGSAIANKNLGLIYRCTGRSAEATKFYEEGVALLDKTTEYSLETDMYLDIIALYKEQLKYKEALESCTECFELIKKRTEGTLEASDKNILNAQYFTCLCFKASAHLKLGQIKEAKECIDMAGKRINPSWTGVWLYPLWETQLEYNIAVENYPEATKYHNLIVKHADKDYLNLNLYLINKKTQIYVGTERYKEACQMYEHASSIKDSLYSVNIARQLDEVRSLYEVDKLEMQAEKNRLNMTLLLLGLLALGVVCLLLGLIIFIVRKNSRKLKEKNHSLFMQLQEKDVLKEKIELLSIHRHLSDEAESKKNSPEELLFGRLQQWLETEKRYTNQKITPEEVATKLSTNTRYLYDAIRQMAGQTFNDYINTLRLEYARKLLLADKKSQMTIEWISAEAGFNTRSNFYRLFRLKFGLTPSELKKQYEELLSDKETIDTDIQ